MKKLVLIGSVLALLFVSIYISAEDSDLFVKTVYIDKVYTHRLGFKIIYPVGTTRLGTLYIPHSWTGYAGAKAEVIYGFDKNYPYMNIYWKDGEFHHIRLYVMSNSFDPSWGVLENHEVSDDVFDVETLEIEF
ncbi:MAG: hypothetical protein ACLFST_00550 [Spirochaetia bacterium]